MHHWNMSPLRPLLHSMSLLLLSVSTYLKLPVVQLLRLTGLLPAYECSLELHARPLPHRCLAAGIDMSVAQAS